MVDGAWLARSRTEVTVLDVRPDQKTFLTPARFETDKKSGETVPIELGGHIADAVPVQNRSVRTERGRCKQWHGSSKKHYLTKQGITK